jgi:hypothetical protein
MRLLLFLVLLTALARPVEAQPAQRPGHKPVPPPIPARPLQPPSPSDGQAGGPPQPQSANRQNQPERDQRGTPQVPFVVEMRNAPKTEAETAEATTEKERKASSDRWTIILAGALVFATGVQFIALLWQGWQLHRSVGVAAQAADEARDAIKAAQASADAANAHASAAEEANRINRGVLTAIDRPWIALGLRIPENELLTFTDTHIEIHLILNAKNIGRSPTMRINCVVWFFADAIEASHAINDVRIRDVPPSRQLSGHGRMLFPEEDFSEQFFVDVSIEAFKESIEARGKEDTPGVFQDEGRPAVVAIAWYAIPGDTLPRHTAIVREIINTLPRRYGFTGSKGTFSDFEIVESFISGRAT